MNNIWKYQLHLFSGGYVRNSVRQGDDLLHLLHGEREHLSPDLLGQVLFARHVPGDELQRTGGLHPDVVLACARVKRTRQESVVCVYVGFY